MKRSPIQDAGLILATVSLCLVSLDSLAREAKAVQGSPDNILFSVQAGHSPGLQPVDDTAGRLKDPAKRAELRAERRAQVQEQYSDLAEVLPLDPKMESDLLDLLTDQRLASLESLHAARESGGWLEDGFTQQLAGNEARNKQQLRELLGEERFVSFLDYTDSMGQRRQASFFNERLAPEDKLTPDQKRRLMQMVREQQEQLIARSRDSSARRMLPPFMAGTAEERSSGMRKQNIVLMEESFRDMQDDSRRFLQQLPTLLTAKQLEVYAKMEAEKIDRQREYVQRMRVAEGMPAEFDETRTQPPPSPRVRVVGRVAVQVSIAVDGGERVQNEFATDNGTAGEPFKVADGLWVEATPILYDDGWAFVEFQYSEELAGKRRPILGRSGTGLQMNQQTMPLGSGRSGTVVSGSKAYAISMDARVASIP